MKFYRGEDGFMLVALYFICGLILLYYGADFLVKGGCNIAVKMKVPNLVIGLTLIAYGTSAPELVVSVDAAAKGLGDVSLGNVVGSNTCNIALILGLCAVITPLQVNPKLLKFDMRIMIVSALLLLGFYAHKNGVDRWEAAFFLICCIIYTVWSFFFSRNNEENAQEEIPKLQCSIWLIDINGYRRLGGIGGWCQAACKFLCRLCPLVRYIRSSDRFNGCCHWNKSARVGNFRCRSNKKRTGYRYRQCCRVKYIQYPRHSWYCPFIYANQSSRHRLCGYIADVRGKHFSLFHYEKRNANQPKRRCDAVDYLHYIYRISCFFITV